MTKFFEGFMTAMLILFITAAASTVCLIFCAFGVAALHALGMSTTHAGNVGAVVWLALIISCGAGAYNHVINSGE